MTAARTGPSEPRFTRAELIADLRGSRARELGLDATAAHVREKLMVFANGERETFVSVDTLAAAINRSVKTVRRALGRLYAMGEVTRRMETTAWGRRSVYRVTRRGPAHDVEAAPSSQTLRSGAAAPPKPSRALDTNDPTGRDTVTRPPEAETLLCDRDQMNDPPHSPPVVAESECHRIEERVLARWRETGLPAIDERRARGAVRRRVAEHVDEQVLLDAVQGAYVRSVGEGWIGVRSAFAVVMADPASVHEYARSGRDARVARERAARAERERRLRDVDVERAAASLLSGDPHKVFVTALASASAGRFDIAAQRFRELEARCGTHTDVLASAPVLLRRDGES